MRMAKCTFFSKTRKWNSVGDKKNRLLAYLSAISNLNLFLVDWPVPSFNHFFSLILNSRITQIPCYVELIFLFPWPNLTTLFFVGIRFCNFIADTNYTENTYITIPGGKWHSSPCSSVQCKNISPNICRNVFTEWWIILDISLATSSGCLVQWVLNYKYTFGTLTRYVLMPSWSGTPS